MTVVDTEHHLIPPCFGAFAARRPASAFARMTDGNVDTQELENERLAAMDEAGVDVGNLSVPYIDTETLVDRGLAVEFVARSNDELIAMSARHPSRFNVLVSLPLPFAEECLAELDRIGRHPAVAGAIVQCHLTSWKPDDLELQPVFEQLGARRLPTMLHPAFDQIGPVDLFADWVLYSSIGAVVATSVAAARVMYSGMLDRIAELDLIVPHLGGVLPFLAQRMNDRAGTGDAEHDALWYMRNRLLFSTCNLFPPALTSTVEAVGPDRIMLGSDYPARGPLTRAVGYVTTSQLDQPAKQTILSETATRAGLARTAGASTVSRGIANALEASAPFRERIDGGGCA